MLGGIDRLVGLFTHSKSSPKTDLRIVSGYTFFDPDAPTHRKAQDTLKAELIQTGLKKSAFDYLVSPSTKPLLTQTHEATGRQSNLMSIRLPTVVSHGSHQIGIVPIRSSADLHTLRNGRPEAFRNVDYAIVFSFLDRLSTRRLVRDSDWIDIAVIHQNARERSSLAPVGSGFLMEAGDRGRYLAKVTIHNPSLGRPLQYTAPKVSLPVNPLFKNPITAISLPPSRTENARLTFELVPLDSQIHAAPSFSKSIARYTQTLKTLYASQSRAGSPIDQPTSPYAGVNSCEDCHPDAVQFWSTTRHAHAWRTLDNLDKTFDAECVECHVTGWQEPGGTSIGFVSELENVQCEVCHGPSRSHAASGGDAALLTHRYDEPQCKACHNEHHSPRFSYPEYRSRIIGTGHGGP